MKKSFAIAFALAATSEAYGQEVMTIWPGDRVEASSELVDAVAHCDFTLLDGSCDAMRQLMIEGDLLARYMMIQAVAFGAPVEHEVRYLALNGLSVLAGEGLPVAQAVEGNRLLFHGRAAEPPSNNPELGLSYLYQADESGMASAAYALAMAHFDGVGVEQSIDRGMRYLLTATERGHYWAGTELAIRAFSGEFGTYPDALIREQLQISAERGHYPAIAGICANSYNSINDRELMNIEGNATLFSDDEREANCQQQTEIDASRITSE